MLSERSKHVERMAERLEAREEDGDRVLRACMHPELLIRMPIKTDTRVGFCTFNFREEVTPDEIAALEADIKALRDHAREFAGKWWATK